MSIGDYKLINESRKVGFWLYKHDLLNLIKIVETRNRKYYNKLVSIYEHLEGKKFDKQMLKIERDGKF